MKQLIVTCTCTCSFTCTLYYVYLSLPDMRDSYASSLRGRQPIFYERHLIAEFEGEKAGSCAIRYHGDNELFQ